MRISAFFYLVCMTLLMVGCGKETAPDMPRSENKLVIELFKRLKTKDYHGALKKVERLRHLNSESVFLAELENTQRTNQALLEVKERLEAKDLGGAEKIIEVTLNNNRDLTELQKLKKELRMLRQTLIISNRLSALKTSYERQLALMQLRNILGEVSTTPKLSTFLNKHEKDIEDLRTKAQKDALLFLALDVDNKMKNGSEIGWNNLAELALLDPNSPVVKHYYKSLSGKEVVPYLLPSEENDEIE